MSQPPSGSSGAAADDGGWNSGSTPRYGSGGDDPDLRAYNSEWGGSAAAGSSSDTGATWGSSPAGSAAAASGPVRRPWTEEWNAAAADSAADQWPQTDPGNSPDPQTMQFASGSGAFPAAQQDWGQEQDWQQWQQWEAPAEPRRGRGVIIALSTVLVVALVAGGGFLAWQQWGKDSGAASTADITKCAKVPEFEPTAFRDTADNGLDITFHVTPACNSRDFMDGRDVSLTVSEVSGSDQKKVAEATFDLSADPLIIEQDGSEVNFEFPADGTFRNAAELSRGAEYEVVVSESGGTAAGAQGSDEGEEGASGDSGEGADSRQAASSSAAPTTSSSAPEACTTSKAGDELEDRRSSDRGKISADLVGKWVPQISSKQVGLVAEGQTWDECSILEELDANTAKYPNVRLAWSSDWSSFDLQDWWVTVVGLPYDSPETALAWCDNHGLDRDHCYAKKITTSGGSNGTTKR